LHPSAKNGLPELNRERIRNARLVANPGCYPTPAILLLAPLLMRGLIELTGIVVDSKSGVSGAGALAKPSTHFPEVVGNFRAYGLLRHRHTPEMEQFLSETARQSVQLLFAPHLLPIDRGILTTVYAKAFGKVNADVLQNAYRECYAGEPFIRIGTYPPAVKHVRGSNFCDLFVTHDPRTDRVVAIGAIDNLVKGASGQAVQNMNLLFGFPETMGLDQLPLCP
jgi:N-acetyl-gamma-glutamyl-phosphate reductase